MSGWVIKILDEVVEYFIDYRGKTPDKKSSGIPLVTAKIVKDGRLQIPTEFISVEDYPLWMTRGYPEINDVVLTTEAPLGEVALLKDKNVALAQRIITMRGFEGVLNNKYLKYWFQSDYGQYELDSRASGTTVFGIKSTVLKKIPIALPSFREQKAIASVLSSLDDKIDLLHRQNKTLESMAETMFRQWFVEGASAETGDGKLSDVLELKYGKALKQENRSGNGYPVVASSGVVGFHHIQDLKQ
ncbi:restriction endonuclease subunit S [Xenorhabdus bovienii]|uniref:restriction endonuclease subunit S n=1 Tax=Xenorhabdus bovienii TaxID=40576 RepID=UPI00237D1074|nr:restriction endonuclease subunit S [Xenorhabdus bovienii]